MPPLQRPQNEGADFRMYLEEKFKRVFERLDDIDANHEETALSIKQLSHIVDNIQIVENRQYFTCPNTTEVSILKEKVAEVWFIKKYYKVFLIAGLITIAGVVGSGIKTWGEYRSLVAKSELLKREIEKGSKVGEQNKEDISAQTKAINDLGVGQKALEDESVYKEKKK